MNNLERLERKIEAYGVAKIYHGKDSGCRCGCNGVYYYPWDEGFKDILEEAKVAIKKYGGHFYVHGGIDWVNIRVGKLDKAYTVYFKE